MIEAIVIFKVFWMFVSGRFIVEIIPVVVDVVEAVSVPTRGCSPLSRAVGYHALPQHINAK